MLKRILVASLALMIALSAMAGCGSAPAETTTAAPTTTATTAAVADAGATEAAATDAATTEAAAEPAPSSQQYEFPWTGDPVTLTYFYVDFSYADMVAADGKLIDDELKKLMGNVTIEDQSVSWADYSTQSDLFFSSGDLPDIMVQERRYATQYGSSGYLLDYAKYLDYMPNYVALDAKYPATFVKSGDSIIAVQQTRDTTIMSMEWIANGYYTKQGFKIPTTYDELYEVCKQVKEQNPDCYPLNFCWNGLAFNDFNVNAGKGNYIFYNNDTEQWEYSLTSEHFKEYVAFMAKMYTEKLLHPNQYDKDWGDQWQGIITDPKAWFLYSGYNEVNAMKVPAMVEKEPTFSVEYMLPPTAGDNHVWIPIEAQPGTDTQFIFSSSKTANPEFLCAFMDYMLSDEVGVLVNWGVEGKTFEVNADGSKSFLPDLILPSNPSVGTIDPIKELSLYPHFMCKQYSVLTKNDFDAMQTFHVDSDCGARVAKYADYVAQNPGSARWFQPVPAQLTEAESDQVGSTMTDIKTFADEQVELFLTGNRDIAEWDAFLAELAGFGDGQAIADLYNSKPQVVLVNE
ncbi:MAG: extracellular solute-binding protein [Clostridiales bacterium]|jgi:ABC-type glycerol-3-phosphate transport system substrate-binding protein|nr:extracellular solute-binding protein [Clostridiales bacterium]